MVRSARWFNPRFRDLFMNQIPKDIVIVGGGAAGYFAAINAAYHCPLHNYTILEASDNSLGKLKISGGGRCNITHSCFDPKLLVQGYPRGAKELRGAFSRFQPSDLIRWFQERGVALKTEGDGRIFPSSDRSETIIECLNQEACKMGIKIRERARVTRIIKRDQGFELEIHGAKSVTADRVLVATGGGISGHSLAEGVGHTIEPPAPSLFTFAIKHPLLSGMMGQSFSKVSLELIVRPKGEIRGKSAPKRGFRYHRQGPMIITHWGLSGPAILWLSAFGAQTLQKCAYKGELKVNFCPEYREEEMESHLRSIKKRLPKRLCTNEAPGGLSRRFWQRLLDIADCPKGILWGGLSDKALKRIAFFICSSTFQITGKGEYKDEFVTCGGVRLNEVEFKTMESRIVPGLFFAGELLDVDGVTGGFNFQNAWTTGWIAGSHIGKLD